jgi:hypothetical protein
MIAPLLLLASINAVIAVVIAYALTRRYGWKPALGLPVAALTAILAVLWQTEGVSVSEALQLAPQMLLFASPTLAGAVIGTLLARRKS